MPPETARPLGPRPMLFVEQYLIDLDGTAAAIRAGYRPAGAAARASVLLRQPAVQAVLAAAMAARARRTGITRARVIEEYRRLAFADWREYADWDGRGVRFADDRLLSADATAAVAELVGGKKRVARVKLFDKLAALDRLGAILAHNPDAAQPDAAREESPEASGAAADAAPVFPLRAPSRKAMTAQRRRFAAEFLVDLNAGAAAIRAGYATRSAPFHAGAIARDPAVAALIARGFAAQRGAIRSDADRVLREYARIAFADIARMARWGKKGLRLASSRMLAEDDAAAIEFVGAAGRAPPRAGIVRLRLHNKLVALDALARHLGLLPRGRDAGGVRTVWTRAARRTSAALRARLYSGSHRA